MHLLHRSFLPPGHCNAVVTRSHYLDDKAISWCLMSLVYPKTSIVRGQLKVSFLFRVIALVSGHCVAQVSFIPLAPWEEVQGAPEPDFGYGPRKFQMTCCSKQPNGELVYWADCKPREEFTRSLGCS